VGAEVNCKYDVNGHTALVHSCDGIDELLKADVAVSSLPTEISFFIGRETTRA
jgi:hypothetical protein